MDFVLWLVKSSSSILRLNIPSDLFIFYSVKNHSEIQMTFETSNKNVKNVDILKQDQRKMITPHLPAHVVVAQGASFSD